MQQDVRLAADDAGGRAGRIDQRRVERHAVPPGRGIGCIGGLQLDRRVDADPPQRIGGAPQPPRIDVEREQAQARVALQQMRGLAAGGDAGIQDALCRSRAAGRRRQRVGHRLRGAVLHRGHAIVETRQVGHRQRLLDPQRIGQRVVDGRGDPGRLEPLTIIVAGGVETIHPQPQRRGRGAGGEDRVGVLRPVAADFRQQPFRPDLRRIGGRKALALRPAQQRIDHAGLMRAAQ